MSVKLIQIRAYIILAWLRHLVESILFWVIVSKIYNYLAKRIVKPQQWGDQVDVDTCSVDNDNYPPIQSTPTLNGIIALFN